MNCPCKKKSQQQNLHSLFHILEGVLEVMNLINPRKMPILQQVRRQRLGSKPSKVKMYPCVRGFVNSFPLTSFHFIPLNFPPTRNKEVIPHPHPEGFLKPLLCPQIFIFNTFSPQSHALNSCVCTDVFNA